MNIVSQNMYECECCDFNTDSSYNFKRHNKSPRHMKKAHDAKIPCCEYCGLLFDDKYKKCRHKKICPDKSNDNLNENSKKGSKISVSDKEQLMEMVKLIDAKIDKVTSNVNKHTTDVNKHTVSMMKYAMINFKNVEPLVELDEQQVYKMLEYNKKGLTKKEDLENETENYIRPVLRYYESEVICEFFGRLIVKYFDRENDEDQQFWTTDVSRLSFIIMQVINKTDREWCDDKTGAKFTKLVIKPMFNAVIKLINDYVNIKQNWIKLQKNIPEHKMSELMECQQQARDLEIEIKYDKLTKGILKYVAPYFNFDSLRMVDKEEKPKKVSKS